MGEAKRRKKLNPNYGKPTSQDDLGDKKGASADYNKEIGLQPDLAFAYGNRGNVRYNLGDKKGAIADYNKAIEL
ncbi:tetratricopeptide repeat protein, partial [Microcoleus sp. AT8-B4]